MSRWSKPKIDKRLAELDDNMQGATRELRFCDDAIASGRAPLHRAHREWGRDLNRWQEESDRLRRIKKSRWDR